LLLQFGADIVYNIDMTTKTENTLTLTFDLSEPNMTKEQARAMLQAELDKADNDFKNGRCRPFAELKKKFGRV
jgi:hypothetical protein